MRLSTPCLVLGCLLLMISCKKVGPAGAIDPSLLLGVWTQQRQTEMTYNNQGLIRTVDVPGSSRYPLYLVFKKDVYTDSTELNIIANTRFPYFPYTVQGFILTLVGSKYSLKDSRHEVRELTAHSLVLHAVIPPENFPSSSNPLPAGTVSVGFVTDKYYAR